MSNVKSNPIRNAKGQPPEPTVAREAPSASNRRGRPPKKAFINVLVKTSTRSALNHLKSVTGLPSQGEVIDYLVSELGRRNPVRET